MEEAKEIEKANWDKARDIFKSKLEKDHKTDAIELFLKDYTSIEDVQKTADKIGQDANNNYKEGYVTIGGKKLLRKEKIATLLERVRQLANIGDIAVKAAPETIGLVWCGFRMMLSVRMARCSCLSYVTYFNR
jgi:hypothetical protein